MQRESSPFETVVWREKVIGLGQDKIKQDKQGWTAAIFPFPFISKP